MSELKRRPSEDDTNGHISKKRALDELSEDGPLTQEDVVYFQKELIWRQMKQYRKQYQMINSTLQDYKKQLIVDQRKIGYLIQWYRQAVQLFDGANSEQIDENLLIKISGLENEDELQNIRDSFIKVLSSLSKTELKDSDRATKIEGLNQELVKLVSSNEALLKKENILNEQVSNLQQQVLELNKIIERSKSKTLKRINGDVKKEEEQNLESTPDMIKNDIKKEDAVNNEEFEKLSIELNEIREVNASLTKQINEEISLNSNLKKELMNSSMRLSNLKEEDLVHSTEYQLVKTENGNLNEEVNDLRLKVKQYFTKITELENEKLQYKLQITNEIAEEKLELVKNLEKLEQDLVRIRTSRDDLISKNSILKNDKSYKELIEEFTKLVDLQKKRIDELTKTKEVSIDGSNELDKDALLKQNSLLVNELKDVESAFKEAHELSIKKLTTSLESTSLLNKLNVEKAKADQKYFSTMRVNDSLLQENKNSKVTISKQQELISSLRDMEKKFLAKIETMDLKFKDLKFLENNLVNENQQFKRKIIELSGKIESITRHNTKLIETSEKLNSEKELEINLRKQKENELIKLSSRLKSIETLNAKYKSNLAGTVMQEDEELIKALRAMVKCSVCSKNWKDTVIKNCGHVFCQDCAQERLAARLRRCPTCNKQFSSNDLLSIHL